MTSELIRDIETAQGIYQAAKQAIPGAECWLKGCDTINDDGTVGRRYEIEIRLQNRATGNGETRRVDTVGTNLAKLGREMAKKLGLRAQRTRQAIAAEKRCS